jgi:hypothetical protein
VLLRLSVIWLVVFILWPFSAQFPTCELVDHFGGSATSQDPQLAARPDASQPLSSKVVSSLAGVA